MDFLKFLTLSVGGSAIAAVLLGSVVKALSAIQGKHSVSSRAIVR